MNVSHITGIKDIGAFNSEIQTTQLELSQPPSVNYLAPCYHLKMDASTALKKAQALASRSLGSSDVCPPSPHLLFRNSTPLAEGTDK
jgi:hypothetical protein